MSLKIVNPIKGGDLRRWPLGDVTQGHGENVALYEAAVKVNSVGMKGHNGWDLVKYEGCPILASAGTICDVKNTPEGYGRHVRIITNPDENGDFLELTYGHLKDIYVKIGDKVTDGFCIGTMGNSGFVISGSTQYWGNAPAGKGVHLHFGVRECTTQKQKYYSVYSSGQKAYIKNYENGIFGSVNPEKYLVEGLKYKLSLYERLLTLMIQLKNVIK